MRSLDPAITVKRSTRRIILKIPLNQAGRLPKFLVILGSKPPWLGPLDPGTLARAIHVSAAINANSAIPIVDLFAGPGGLGEGFAAFSNRGISPFQISLSVEKDPVSCATLALRKYFREFKSPPAEFDAYFSGEISRDKLFAAFPAQAKRAQETTWEAELGKQPVPSVASRVRTAIKDRRDWVLLGGPPCQAYSIAGRSRMRYTHANFERDERHFLYREYLRIVADHEPAVFVMENVKGLLTSTHDGGRIVSKILDDLSSPGIAVGNARNRSLHYRLYALDRRQTVLPWMEEGPSDGEEYLVKAESFGIPQNRHRVFIVGVRSDVAGRPRVLCPQPEISVHEVLSDMPPIRSALSREDDSLSGWRDAIIDIMNQQWMARLSKSESSIFDEIKTATKKISKTNLRIGARHMKYSGAPLALGSWYRDKATGISLHDSRSHMREDLHRYLFCSSFAKVHGRSPKLRDFPKELFPTHRNVTADGERNAFEDRFRVQLANQPATTITSHVSKDGHYYIHYDPTQCRSLTVREAARLQTFPDNYFFEGGRTEQYRQVGNAVPPLLAREIAAVIFDLLAECSKPFEKLSAIS
jgi:DNA (cytosine-5)-methyltransferase 1